MNQDINDPHHLEHPVFTRISEALQTPRHSHHDPPQKILQPENPDQYRQWLPPVENTYQSMLENFTERSELLKTEFLTCPSKEKLPELLKQTLEKHQCTNPATHQASLTSLIKSILPENHIDTSSPFDPVELEKCDIGITECEALVAQTGSALVSSKASGGRTLSILVPHHIVLASKDQLIPDMPAAMSLIAERYPEKKPSMICFQTGPSRTGDIERILVLGAHGPKKLTIILIEE